MISKKTLTVLLAVVILVLSYQTYALASMTKKLEDVSLSFGGAQSAVDLTNSGTAKSMVGGC